MCKILAASRLQAIAVMNTPLIIIYIGALAIPSLIYSLLRRFQPRLARKFPGPRQFPLIGRVHDLPKGSLWLKLTEWANAYGPIYETSMMGQRFIVISNEEMAEDVLIKKGNYFGGRAQIRALIDHKLGPTYVALQDRNGTNHVFCWSTEDVS